MKALFAGSFDPFTRGHQSIVDRVLKSVADEIIVAIGINYVKKSMFSVEDRIAAIEKLYADNPRVKVVSYTGLTVDYAKTVNADFLVRGVRSVTDFEFERNIADVNKRLSGIETVLLFTEPELSCVSSSVVRELMGYGKDVTEFLAK